MITLATGLLLLRLLLGALLLAHGLQKSIGEAKANTAKAFESWGFVPAKPLVWLAAAAEILSGVLILVGFETQIGAAIALGTLVVAMTPNLRKGFWASRGGFELPFAYVGLVVAIAFTGPGSISLDSVLRTPHNMLIAIGTLIVGLLGALPPLLRRRAELSRRSRAAE